MSFGPHMVVSHIPDSCIPFSLRSDCDTFLPSETKSPFFGFSIARAIFSALAFNVRQLYASRASAVRRKRNVLLNHSRAFAATITYITWTFAGSQVRSLRQRVVCWVDACLALWTGAWARAAHDGLLGVGSALDVDRVDTLLCWIISASLSVAIAIAITVTVTFARAISGHSNCLRLRAFGLCRACGAKSSQTFARAESWSGIRLLQFAGSWFRCVDWVRVCVRLERTRQPRSRTHTQHRRAGFGGSFANTNITNANAAGAERRESRYRRWRGRGRWGGRRMRIQARQLCWSWGWQNTAPLLHHCVDGCTWRWQGAHKSDSAGGWWRKCVVADGWFVIACNNNC